MTNLNRKLPTTAPPPAATEAPQIGADPKTAWARRPRETARAYEYALEYFKMGPRRSIEKVAQRFTKNPRPLKRYSKKWQWVRRAARYDRWVEGQNLEAMEIRAREDAAKWAQRYRDRRERKYRTSEALLDRHDTMVKAPLFEVTRGVATDENGRATEIQTFKPVKWTARDMVRCAEVGCALGDQAIQNEGGADEIEVQNVIDDEDVVPYKSAGKRPRSKSRS